MSAGPNALVIAGPSGVGKGTLIDMLKQEYPASFGFSVSHTTRQPRDGEKNDVHYHFVTVPQMEEDIKAGKFLEHANVHGNFYGTSIAAVEKVKKTGKICILDIDVQGCRACRTVQLPGTYVFVSPPSLAELEKRLRGRGTETEEKIVKRLANAKGELDARNEAGLFDHQVRFHSHKFSAHVHITNPAAVTRQTSRGGRTPQFGRQGEDVGMCRQFNMNPVTRTNPFRNLEQVVNNNLHQSYAELKAILQKDLNAVAAKKNDSGMGTFAPVVAIALLAIGAFYCLRN